MTARDTLPSGTPLLEGRFVITGVIADGGQATTYEGIDKSNGQRVAIKRFSVRGASSWKEVELAEREARVLSGLRHPGLPKVITHFEESGALYLVLEYIEGATLEQLRVQHRLQQVDVLSYLQQVAEILDYLHSQSPPIVHRDIKPRNLIRRPDGSIVLVDFGSVRDHLKPEGGSTVVGTFGYMAPEQFQGRAMPASDTYGAAATALALLTGREPDQLPHQGLKLDVERSLGNTAPPALKRLLTATLEPNPDVRAASLRGALLTYRIHAGAHTAAASSAPPRRGQRSSARSDESYADLGEAPFHTPDYRRDRSSGSRAQRRRARREYRRARRHGLDIDVETPFVEVLGVPEVRRALRIPLVGALALMLLLVLRTVLWAVLNIAVPRVLLMLQKVTRAPLADAIERTTGAGETLNEQLDRVTERLRSAEPTAAEPTGADPPRYRVAAPSESPSNHSLAEQLRADAQAINDELENTLKEWQDSRKR